MWWWNVVIPCSLAGMPPGFHRAGRWLQAFVCGFLPRTGTDLESCPLHLSSHSHIKWLIFPLQSLSSLWQQPIALIRHIFKPEESSITDSSSLAPCMRLGHRDGWCSAASRAWLPREILGSTNPALGKMEIINVLVLKFVFQRVISRDVSWKVQA